MLKTVTTVILPHVFIQSLYIVFSHLYVLVFFPCSIHCWEAGMLLSVSLQLPPHLPSLHLADAHYLFGDRVPFFQHHWENQRVLRLQCQWCGRIVTAGKTFFSHRLVLTTSCPHVLFLQNIIILTMFRCTVFWTQFFWTSRTLLCNHYYHSTPEVFLLPKLKLYAQ